MGQALGLGGPITASASGELIRREEQLRVGVTRVPSERVRLIRRIVTESRMVPVQVRREVLQVERSPIDAAHPDGISTPNGVPAPLEIVLHEEIPVVTFDIRPVERVRVSIQEFSGETTVRAQVASEQVEVVTIPPPASTV